MGFPRSGRKIVCLVAYVCYITTRPQDGYGYPISIQRTAHPILIILTVRAPFPVCSQLYCMPESVPGQTSLLSHNYTEASSESLHIVTCWLFKSRLTQPWLARLGYVASRSVEERIGGSPYGFQYHWKAVIPAVPARWPVPRLSLTSTYLPRCKSPLVSIRSRHRRRRRRSSSSSPQFLLQFLCLSSQSLHVLLSLPHLLQTLIDPRCNLHGYRRSTSEYPFTLSKQLTQIYQFITC